MYKCNEQRNLDFSTPEVWTDEENGKINIRKSSKFLGVVELGYSQAKKVIKGLAFELMKKQDQSRKYCPCCGASLE